MNRIDVLDSTLRFMMASQEYVMLIHRVFISDGSFREEVSTAQLQRIRDARQRAQGLEDEMYAIWQRNGIE